MFTTNLTLTVEERNAVLKAASSVTSVPRELPDCSGDFVSSPIARSLAVCLGLPQDDKIVEYGFAAKFDPDGVINFVQVDKYIYNDRRTDVKLVDSVTVTNPEPVMQGDSTFAGTKALLTEARHNRIKEAISHVLAERQHVLAERQRQRERRILETMANTFIASTQGVSEFGTGEVLAVGETEPEFCKAVAQTVGMVGGDTYSVYFTSESGVIRNIAVHAHSGNRTRSANFKMSDFSIAQQDAFKALLERYTSNA